MATLGTFTAGQVLTAAELNAIGTWTAYTPEITATGFSIGNATTYGYYTVVNDIVNWRFGVNFGTTTSFGSGRYNFTLPVEASNDGAYATIGQLWVFKSSTSWLGPVFFNNLSTTSAYATTHGASDFTATSPTTLTSASWIRVWGTYRKA